MTWLVTGGAGYIGSHVVRALAAKQASTRWWSTTSRAVTATSCRPRRRSCAAPSSTASCCSTRSTSTTSPGVVHIAGFKYAGGLGGAPAAHLRAERQRHAPCCSPRCEESGVGRIVFSSSAAVYGTPDADLVTEDTPKRPELALRRVEAHRRVAAARPGGRERAGAHRAALLQRGRLGRSASCCDTSPHNLFPLVFDALARGAAPRHQRRRLPRRPDGTNVRDYVHVADIAAAHVAAAQAARGRRAARAGLQPGQRRRASRSARSWMPWRRGHRDRLRARGRGPRRAGDPARIVASGDLAARDLDWRMRHTLRRDGRPPARNAGAADRRPTRRNPSARAGGARIYDPRLDAEVMTTV